MSILLNIIAFIFAIGILVTFHEFGHYWVAKKSGVKVLRFSVGFGRSLYQWLGADGTQYRIAAIPLGGYVKMLDEREDPNIDPNEQHRAFNRQSLQVRSVIVAAGPLANFLLAFILSFLTFVIGISGVRPVIGEVRPDSVAANAGVQIDDEILAVNNQDVKSWQEVGMAILDVATSEQQLMLELTQDKFDEASRQVTIDTAGLNMLGDDGYMEALGFSGPVPRIPAIVADISSGGSADRYGLQIGDQIVAFNGESVADWGYLVDQVQQNASKSVELTVERNGQVEVLPIEIDAFEQDDGKLIGRIGVRVDTEQAREELKKYQVFIRYGPLESVWFAAVKTWEITRLTFKILWQIVTGSASLKNISGPLTIAEVAGTSIAIGIGTYLSTLALLSISIGILNLLPIPLLDGGHLLYYLIEFFKGSPVSENTQGLAQHIGIALLGGLMLLALYNDIYRLLY